MPELHLILDRICHPRRSSSISLPDSPNHDKAPIYGALLFEGEFEHEAASVGVLGIKGERASHQLYHTAAKEESEAKSFSEHIDLGELLEYEVGFVCRDTRTCILDGEAYMGVIGIDTHGDAALCREMEGIEEQLCEDDVQMVGVGLNGKRIRQMALHVHLSGMGDEVACTLIGLTGQLVAADGIVGADRLVAFDE